MAKSGKKSSPGSIAQNRRARHDYFIEDQLETGIVLEGWEVKSLKKGQGTLNEAYIKVFKNELYLVGSNISPLNTSVNYINYDKTRTKKLLLNKRELDKYIGKIKISGYTIVPLNYHDKKGKVKVQIGLAKGKKQYDKRRIIKDRELNREKNRVLKKSL